MYKEMLFETRSVTAGYGDNMVIHDICFTLKPHTLTALIGPNGCGKSTLLKSIANELTHEGSCYLQGQQLEQMSMKKKARMVSYMPQKSGIHISLPVLDVVLMGYNPVLKLLERPSKSQRTFAKEALERVGLKRFEHVDYLTLSEGQKQLVFLARTMIEDTSLLLLDEPDSALDFQNRHLILGKLKEMVGKGNKAGLLCLHDPALALDYCDQIIVLKEGSIVGSLNPKEDSISDMEKILREIYGNVSIVEHADKKGRKHYILLWED